MHSPLSDTEIISLYQNGDSPAFKELIDKYTPVIFNFIARQTDADTAADITQEVFIKVWKHINNFDGKKASFKTWIFTIAKNTTTDYLRKKKSFTFSQLERWTHTGKGDEEFIAENIEDPSLLPNALLEKIEDETYLDSLLQKLKPEYREVLTLHYQEEMTFEEIGIILQKPLNTVKSQHRRALLEMRKGAE